MSDKTYNGWTNYETWNVKLWIDNEEGSYNYWREQAQEVYDDAKADADDENGETREEAAISSLRDVLQSHFEEQKDELLDAAKMSSSMWADLLGAALSEVNWHEIAVAMIDECDKDDAE